MRIGFLLALLLIVASGCSSNGGPNGSCPGGLNCACEVASECNGGFRCVSAQCKSPGSVSTGGACWATDDCVSGSYCNALTGRCALITGTAVEGGTCATDADCLSPGRCDYIGLTGRCRQPGLGDIGDACSRQTDCLAGLFCGTTQTCRTYTVAFPSETNPGVLCMNEGAFRAYFEVPRPSQAPRDFYRLPYPNNIRVSGTTLSIADFYVPPTAPLNLNLARIYVDKQVAEFEGFSPTAPVTLRFSKDINFDTLRSSPPRLIDLTAGSEPGVAFSYTRQSTKWSCENRLSVSGDPADPLVAGHTYAVVITTAVRSTANETPAQDPDLQAVLGGSRPADASLGAAWDAFAPLRAYAGLGPVSDIATASVFTIADVQSHMRKVAAAVAAKGDPTLTSVTLCDGVATSPCADGSTARACGSVDSAFYEIHGKISMPIYQQGTAPYDTTGGNITESASAANEARVEDVCFAVTIPKGPTMPGAGWPLVVFAHGTGGSFRDFISNGVAAAAAGAPTPMAVLSFDMVGHGARRGGSTKDPADIVFNVLNPPAARDGWLQGAADVLTALKVANLTQAVPSGPTLDFDPAKVAFFGHSQGATSGELALPYTNVPRAVVLSGAGANLRESIAAKTSPFRVADTLRFVLGDKVNIDQNHPMTILFQTYFDRSDPLSYAPNVVRQPLPTISAKHVYMSWGTGDTYSPLATLENNARGLGLRPVMPVIEQIDASVNSLGAQISRPVSIPAVFQYSSGGEGHFVAFQNTTAKTDWLAFLNSYFSTGTPNIP